MIDWNLDKIFTLDELLKPNYSNISKTLVRKGKLKFTRVQQENS